MQVQPIILILWSAIYLLRTLSAIIDHPSYTSSPTTNYDYSLLRLSSGLVWSSHSHIRPVCLPQPGDSYSTGDPMVVTGQVLVSFRIMNFSLFTILSIRNVYTSVLNQAGELLPVVVVWPASYKRSLSTMWTTATVRIATQERKYHQLCYVLLPRPAILARFFWFIQNLTKLMK